MTLNSIVVHKLNKESQGVATNTLRSSLLGISPRETEFISNIKQIYYKKSNPTYGVFHEDSVSYPFQKMLRKFLNNRVGFLKFTKNAMAHYLSVIDSIPQATGGYVLFAHYTSNAEDFLLIVMLNNKKQYNINNDLSIDEIFSLDIDKLDVANTINITKWNSNEDTYLSFARGRKDVSQYFMRFIGCIDQTSAKESSKNLKRALLDYIEVLDIDDAEKEDIKNQIYNYCKLQISNNSDISLSHISSIFDPDDPDLFKEFASDEEYRVNPFIKGHKQTLRSLKYYAYRSKELSIEFDSSLLDQRIFYNSVDNKLTICNIPDDLKNQILNLHEVEEN